MKRFFALLLSAAMLLSLAACGEKGTTVRRFQTEQKEDDVKKDPVAAQYLEQLTVKTAEYPALPERPSHAQLEEAFNAIDYDKMGAEAYEKAQEQIPHDRRRQDKRQSQYHVQRALEKLRQLCDIVRRENAQKEDSGGGDGGDTQGVP